MSLSKTGEQLIELLREKHPLFFKDLPESLCGPKPVTATVDTLFKLLQKEYFAEHKIQKNHDLSA